MKKAIRYVSLAFVAVFGIALMGCTQASGTEPAATIEADVRSASGSGGGGRGNDAGDRSRRTDLALMRTLGAHQVDIPELSQIVLDAFNNMTADPRAGRSAVAASSITEIRSVPTNTRNRFERSERFGRGRRGNQGRPDGPRGRSADEQETETVELYEFAISDGSGDTWFVLASNDVRVGHVLAITHGSFEASDSELAAFLRSSLSEYIEAIVYEFNDITDDEAEAELGTLLEIAPRGVATPGLPANPSEWEFIGYSSNMQVQRRPLLQTQWGQGSIDTWSTIGFAYNNYIRHYFRNNPDGNRFVTGCGPTAVAQIVAFHNFMNPTAASRANMAPPFTDATSSTMNMGTWNGQYNLSLIRTMSIIRNSSSAAARGQVAALMFHVFRELRSVPSSGSTNSQPRDKAPAFRSFGYVIAHEGAATALSGTSSNFSIQYHTGLDIIRSSIDNSRPILAFGRPAAGPPGHFWVIDGYGSVTWIEEHYRHRTSHHIFTRRITLNNVLMVHCNMGWDGNHRGYNGWYIYGIFDTVLNRYRSFLYQNIAAGDRNYSSNTWLVIPRRP